MNATERSECPACSSRAEIHDDLEQALAGAASAAHAELVCQGERAFVVAEHRGLEVPHAGRERPDAERLNECVPTPAAATVGDRDRHLGHDEFSQPHYSATPPGTGAADAISASECQWSAATMRSTSRIGAVRAAVMNRCWSERSPRLLNENSSAARSIGSPP